MMSDYIIFILHKYVIYNGSYYPNSENRDTVKSNTECICVRIKNVGKFNTRIVCLSLNMSVLCSLLLFHSGTSVCQF